MIQPFCLTILRPPRPTLFPYTTLFRSANMKIWQAYGVNSWPTLYLVDPEGYLVGRGSGEGLGDAVDGLVTKLIKEHRAKDRKSTRLNSSHTVISYAVFCLKKKNKCRRT